jgi:hypothetical protein
MFHQATLVQDEDQIAAGRERQAVSDHDRGAFGARLPPET